MDFQTHFSFSRNLLVLLLCPFISYSSAAVTSATSSQCTALSSPLGNKVLYPDSPLYRDSLASYFSEQEEELSPACIVAPANSQDVATAISVLSSQSAKFAIRSGGYSTLAGSANIDGGVTLDMRSINQIVVSKDQACTSIGTGATWADVYYTLDAMNLTVSGGRSSYTGVGGLLLGGGISHFSTRKGFACDNVLNFEVVLASGQVVNANEAENPDLWIALKGGSNNFGVVTRYDLQSFEQGNFWGGIIYYPISTAPQQLEAFADFNAATAYDEYATITQSFAYSESVGLVALNAIEYTKPVVNPPALQPFTAIQPQLKSTIRISNISDFALEQSSQVRGLRESIMTTTFKNDLAFMKSTYAMWNESLASLSLVPGMVYSVTYEPIPPALTSKSASQGGNSLGLGCTEKLVLLQLFFTWNETSSDDLVLGAGKQLIDDIDRAAESARVFHRFKYLPYAAKFQDPISGYGPESKAHLQGVSRKYDPHGLFQDSVPGGFKLFT